MDMNVQLEAFFISFAKSAILKIKTIKTKIVFNALQNTISDC